MTVPQTVMVCPAIVPRTDARPEALTILSGASHHAHGRTRDTF